MADVEREDRSEDDPHATVRAVTDAVKSIARQPLSLIGRNAGAATHPFIGNSQIVGGDVFDGP